MSIVSLDAWNLRPVEFDLTRIERGVLPPKKLRAVKALTDTHNRRLQGPPVLRTPHESHCRCTVLLFHGKPGMDKTNAACSTADYIRRPFLKMAFSEIGDEADKMEENLRSTFDMAKACGAVILMDEADIYLEKQGGSDLKRNTVVSVMLRVLDEYTGLLILTSNRVGTFDDAFINRIKFKQYFSHLMKEEAASQKMWDLALEDLEVEMEGKVIIQESFRRYAASEAVRRLRWSVRDIRNSTDYAAAVARNEPLRDGKVNIAERNLRDFVDDWKSFSDYLDSVHHDESESKRAGKSRRRNDEFENGTID